jgi:hypothetical protein
MAAKLFRRLPALDVIDPEEFITGTIAIFARYPEEVLVNAIDPVKGIPGRADKPTLKFIKAVCDEYHAPAAASIARQRAMESYLSSLPPPREPRTPEQQARVDASIAEWHRRRTTLEPAPIRIGTKHGRRHSSEHAARVVADLAERARRRLQSTEGCGND